MTFLQRLRSAIWIMGWWPYCCRLGLHEIGHSEYGFGFDSDGYHIVYVNRASCRRCHKKIDWLKDRQWQ